MNASSPTKTKGTWGGARVGAGRKKLARNHDAPHRTRPELSSRYPVHVVLRVRRGVGQLRRGKMYQAIRRVLQRYLGRADFRVVHLSIQNNHVHFLIESANKRALSRGMQSLAINCARALKLDTRHAGKVFEYRYHATQIRTARQARNALAYVLNNWRRHREDLTSPRAMNASVDPYSSGISFTGWSGRPRFALPDGYDPLPVSLPKTALLSSEWEWHGRIGLFECPGPLQ
ncbi:MAG: transposase [Kofleriaceae bacterium]